MLVVVVCLCVGSEIAVVTVGAMVCVAVVVVAACLVFVGCVVVVSAFDWVITAVGVVVTVTVV